MSTQKIARSRWRLAAVNERGYRIGETHFNAKLTDDDIELIRQLRAEGLSYAVIARKFDDIGLSKTMAHDICTYKRRAHSVAGHRRAALPRMSPAALDEFDD